MAWTDHRPPKRTAQELLDNTVESPLPDGGGSVVKANTNVRKSKLSARFAPTYHITFLNEDTCIISNSPNACAVGSSYQSELTAPRFLIPLNETIIRVLYQESGAGEVGTIYLYAVDGLRIEDDKLVSPPCKRNARSRWVKVDCFKFKYSDRPQTQLTQQQQTQLSTQRQKSSSGA
jgi:hypothetical protein